MARRRVWRFWIVIVVGTGLLIETTSFLISLLLADSIGSISEFPSLRREIIAAAENADDTPLDIPVGVIDQEVIHPYVGYVIDPTAASGYTPLGFSAPGPSLQPADPDVFVIGVFGGSFAEGVVRNGREILRQAIEGQPNLGGKRVEIQSIALGGYKQPQQLMALTYLQALGTRFDVVVNIDGFNEVALPPAELPREVFPFYPRGWITRVNNVIDPVELRLIAGIIGKERQRLRFARLVDRAPLSWSPTCTLVWRLYDLRLENSRNTLSAAFEKRITDRHDSMGFTQVGPEFPILDDVAYMEELVRMWAAASLRMDRLCRTDETLYLHFLQPNQYVPEAKPMGLRERRVAIDLEHPYRAGVVSGYPRLAEAGVELAENGVVFRDLRFLFSDVSKPLFIDSCCHVNPEGYAMVADEVAAEILSQLSQVRR